MRGFAALLVGLILAEAGMRAGDKPAPIPTRYQEIPKSKLARLVEVWGTPEVEPTMGHTIVFSADGKLALLADGGYQPFGGNVEDAVVSLWDVAKGQIIQEWREPKAGVSALTLTADGKRALLAIVEPDPKEKGRENAFLRLRDLSSGKHSSLEAVKSPILSVAISADGKHALTGTVDGTLLYWDLVKGTKLMPLPTQKTTGPITSVGFTPGGKTAFSSGQDNMIRVWDLHSGKELRSMTHAAGVMGLSISADGGRLASLSFDNTIKVWDVAGGKELKTLKRETQNALGIGTVALAPDGKKVLAVIADFDGAGMTEVAYVTLWDAASGKQLWSVKSDFKGLAPIHYEQKVIGGGANRFTQWDFERGAQIKSWGRHKGAVSAIAVTGKGVVSAGQDGSLQPWRGWSVSRRKGHSGAINAVAVCAKDKWLITGGGDKTVKVWKAGNDAWEEAHTFTGHTDSVTSVGVAPDGTWAVSGSADRTLKTWDLATGKELDTLAGHARNVNAVAVSPDGTWIASASDDGNVRLWPIKNGKSAGVSIVLDGHKREVMSVAFSPDGKHLLSGSQDMTLKLWDVGEAAVVKTLEGHKNWVNAVAFRDNNQAASASDDLTVRLWDLQKGAEIDQIDLSQSTDVARSLAFDQKTNALLVGTASWVILRFELAKGKSG